MPEQVEAQTLERAQQSLAQLESQLARGDADGNGLIQEALANVRAALDEMARDPAQEQREILSFQKIVEEVGEFAMIALDRTGSIRSWNRGAERIFGYTKAEIVGQPIAVIFTQEDIAAGAHQQELETAAGEGRAEDKRWHVRKDGTRFWADGVVTPIYDPQQQLVGFSKMLRDTTERKLLEEDHERLLRELEFERAQLTAVLDQMPSGVAIAEAPSGKMLLHNKAARQLLRHPLLASDDFTGYSQYGGLHVDGRPYLPEEYPLARAVMHGEVVDQEDMLYRRGDGTTTYFSVNAAPVRDGSGKIVAAASTFHDIAERRRAQEELERLYRSEQQARAEAEEALQVRDAFLAIAAHELRNPIAGLLGFAQVLERRLGRQGGLSDRDRRALHAITSQAETLNRLIDSLLDVARLQSGRFELDCHPLDLFQFAQRVVDQIEPTLERHVLEAHCLSGSCIVNGDELRLEQVLLNLIQNAVKYSPQGGRVTVSVEQDQREVVLSVADEGIGIPEADRAHLFERFYRAGNVRGAAIRGMGIGLYVVHEIVTLHRGTIEVESREGSGSTFLIRLPVYQGMEQRV